MQGPPGNPDAPIPPQWADVLELAFTLLFTSEMLIKMVAMGLACHRGAYLSDNWNRLDFIVVLLGWLPYILPSLGNLSAIRSLRALRPLRSISVLPGVKRQATTLLDSMPKMADVLVLFGFSLSRCMECSAFSSSRARSSTGATTRARRPTRRRSTRTRASAQPRRRLARGA